ncbi:MAG: putative glycoside hydrolase [Candidatus Nealsonbacteria bacterium]|nr:putative glycoside hydrolase [Candidatus Nealsonbacteria bacterium]
MKVLIVLVILLLVFSAGGFFILNSWKIFPVETEENPVIEVFEQNEPLVEEVKETVQEPEPLTETEAIKNAKEKSSNIKAVYLNEFMANSAFRQNIQKLIENTELNGVVIDVKEAAGPNLPNSLKSFINELHQKDIWVIARISAFRDSSLKEKNPELYLKDMITTSSDNIWYDSGGAAWLDPSSQEVQQYILDFSKKAIDFGFDEIQFDYVRFPSDGDLEVVSYPFYDKEKEKYQVIKEFFSKTAEDLRQYKPSIILSADIFGYVATQYQAFEIGQRLVDVGEVFDYISFMVYPSHFYNGFKADEDLKRGLPALNLPYESQSTTTIVSNNPYQVVLRSVFSAVDYLSFYNYQARVRPWLQDFNLAFDTKRGIYYTADKVRDQIQAAEDAGSSGWLLWNPASVYTEQALKIE